MPDQASLNSWLTFLLGPFGLTVGLLALVFCLFTERLVPGSTHNRVRAERDRALARLDRAVHVTGRAVEVADPDAKRTGT
jgi:hypothetical protein